MLAGKMFTYIHSSGPKWGIVVGLFVWLYVRLVISLTNRKVINVKKYIFFKSTNEKIF